MARPPPTQPWVAIMGTTGTGKSDLAVDLAVKFNGEIINADAMQMYRGMPIITNQISEAEQRGIPHHLLATINHSEPTWNVAYFAREARRIMSGIRARGKLPIVVGGTHYYINSLLFDDTIVAEAGVDDFRSKEEAVSQFPILNGPTDLMYKRLQEVDPAMAERWHPEERRRIKRSLEIFLTTGKRASDIYAQQQVDRKVQAYPAEPWQALMFWVYSNPEILNERLDKRIDKMEQRGLMEEVRELAAYLDMRASHGEIVDRTHGIWQSIGFKQMEPFLDAEKRQASPHDLQHAKVEGLELMKNATRQYARSQIKWLRNKTGHELKETDALQYLYLLDSSEANQFSENVLQPAADILHLFLEGQTLPPPCDLSETAQRVLSAFSDSVLAAKPVIKLFTCRECNITVNTELQWDVHLKGRRHRRTLKSKSRTALVPISMVSEDVSKQTKLAITENKGDRHVDIFAS